MIYIYIYILRERERERERGSKKHYELIVLIEIIHPNQPNILVLFIVNSSAKEGVTI